jgi:hypothetical protein
MGDLRPDPRLLKSGRALGSPARQLADGLLVVDDQDEGSGCHWCPPLAHYTTQRLRRTRVLP